MTHNLFEIEEHLGVTFVNKELLEQALVHRSYLNENPEFPHGNNERLEFLGDAVLELVVTEFLYRNYQNPEGDLTNWRASLVNTKMLGEVANELHLRDYLYLSRGEAKETNTKARTYILANAFEAIVGAMYIDQGFSVAENFIQRVLLPRLPHILEYELYRDPKSAFQEAAQEKVGITPNYRVLSETGPDHAKIFTIGIFLGSDLVAEGKGASKQEGEESAARAALKVKSW
ncbi:MAG: ribonuclease III [Patescibacteria group bacterium]|jgi:ribonuclease-3